ncbi:MAG: hypothetical protein Kow00129_14340 [Thermoleophilia bacterium]
MAVGGMVGGGIFSVLGVVVERAGSLAWLSFVIGGLVALATGYSYARLAGHFEEGGGAFAFLRRMEREGFAAALSWVLIIGYVLTISVYAFTFGHYVGEVLGFGPVLIRILSVAVVLSLVGVNLLGVAEAGGFEIVTVWGKVLVLLLVASVGLWRWNPDMLDRGVPEVGPLGVLVGAATVFMAYEGFQLLTYDYDDIKRPRRTLFQATLAAISTVIVLYVIVAVGSASLVGAGTLVEQKEIALVAVGREAFGFVGVVLVSVAAAFSTGSAINATLFATARLARDVSAAGELPRAAAHENSRGIPDRSVLFLGVLGALLASVGSLSQLVEAASLIFLFTFGAVNFIALRELERGRWVFGAGMLGAGAAGVTLVYELAHSAPYALGFLLLLVLLATVVRPYLLRRLG